jgi:hypothetical protein
VTSGVDRQPGLQVNSIQKMASALNSVLSEMKHAAVIPQETLGAAESHMAALLQGIQAIASSSQMQHQASVPPVSVPELPVVSTTGEGKGYGHTRRTTIRAKTNHGSTPYGAAEVFQEVEEGAPPA